jgi:NADH-quinone oxidoreductase subunit K
MVPVEWYLWLSAAVFSIGVFGFLARSNIIIMFMSIELMLNAVNIALITFGHYMNDLRGPVLSFFVITVAASEAAIGLAIIIALFRNKETADVDEMTETKG